MITPVLLCGGSGTRLWPLSRKSFPKQFSAILGDQSLLQSTALRFSGPGFSPPLVVTGNEFRFIVTDQLRDCDINPAAILIEPTARNTAPAALAAALYLAAQDPEALLLLSPTDHAIAGAAAFRAAVALGHVAAEAGQIVIFGIQATRAETGYGWLEAGAATFPGVQRLTRFIEKPDAARAAQLFANPHHLWNAGVVLVRASVLIEAFAAHAPDILAILRLAMAGAEVDLGFTRIAYSSGGTGNGPVQVVPELLEGERYRAGT